MSDNSPAEVVASLVSRARIAQQQIQSYSQAQIDTLVTAVAYVVMDDEVNKRLSQLAVEETGLGNVADKMVKNRRKTLGLIRDIRGAKTVGEISHDAESGIT